MLKHIFITKNDGTPIFSKCYHHTCGLSDIENLKKHQLSKVLKLINPTNPFAKIKVIEFEDMKLMVAVRKNITVFFEVDKATEDKKYRDSIENLADEVNNEFKKENYAVQNKKISFVLEKSNLEH